MMMSLNMKLNYGFMENYRYMKIDKIQNKKEISEQLQYELDMRAEEVNKYFEFLKSKVDLDN